MHFWLEKKVAVSRAIGDGASQSTVGDHGLDGEIQVGLAQTWREAPTLRGFTVCLDRLSSLKLVPDRFVYDAGSR
jgi:hypothetical protein